VSTFGADSNFAKICQVVSEMKRMYRHDSPNFDHKPWDFLNIHFCVVRIQNFAIFQKIGTFQFKLDAK
jgi:hypothetical protein